MVIDYAGRKNPEGKQRNKLIAALIIIAAFAIIALLILLLVNQRHRQQQIHPSQTTQPTRQAEKKSLHNSPKNKRIQQQHYEFYTLLPKLSTSNAH